MGSNRLSLSKRFGLLLFLTSSFVAYQNCTETSLDNQAPNKSSTESPAFIVHKMQKPKVADGETPNYFEALKLCDQAAAQGQMREVEQSLIFEDTKVETGKSKVCNFNSDDNLSPQNGFIRARFEQKVSLNLPETAVLCDLDVKNSPSQFAYSEALFFTMNDRIVAASDRSALLSTSAPESGIHTGNGMVPLFKYDWLALRSGRFSGATDMYCLGGNEGLGKCSFSEGSMSFDRQLLIYLGLLSAPGQQNFGVVVTGGSDSETDCYHEKLAFKIQAKFYLRDQLKSVAP